MGHGPSQVSVICQFLTSKTLNINTFENRMLMLDGMPAVRVKTELLESEQGSPNVHNYPDMEAVPLLLNNVKGEPPEDSVSVDHFQTQTEPVDLSINKARTSPTAVSSSPVSMTASASSPSSTSTSSSSSSRPASSPTVITSVSSASSSSTVLTPGPLVASASGVGGQQFLHIIHPVPPSSPMNLQSNKLSHVHRIPVVVQSVPVVYTAVRSPGNVNNTIVVPLLEDGRSHGKAQMDPRGLSPRQSKSDSDDDDLPNVTLDSVNETGSTALSIARAVQEWKKLRHTDVYCIPRSLTAGNLQSSHSNPSLSPANPRSFTKAAPVFSTGALKSLNPDHVKLAWFFKSLTSRRIQLVSNNFRLSNFKVSITLNIIRLGGNNYIKYIPRYIFFKNY
ncbi:Krueppel-like factor 12 isoform X4 [Loxodonta africana]|uniref:Krueppel-like factor 12 isoform X4 n=1 Tax=Loxodonta africana TaxID=9785 RepID=UPI000C81383B|nr:Krueppel-like factor 12 isoform X4 [Loxodonta africana]